MCQIYAKINEENHKIQKIQFTSPECETMCITGIRKTYQELSPVDTGRKLNVHMTFRRRSIYVMYLRGQHFPAVKFL